MPFLSYLAQFAPVAPESPNAEGISDSWLFVSIFVFAIFVLVEGLLIAFIWKYRRRGRPRFEDGAQAHGATKLELAWTAFPVVVLFLIGAFVFIELPGIKDIPEATAGEEQLEIKVTGRQFYWQYEYPNGVIAIDQLRAPVGVPVSLEVTAPDTDVIHSWWIPALGGKIDAIPGVTNETWFQASNEGVYTGQCAELCGLEHAQMLASVEVLSTDEFDAWLDTRRAEQDAGSGELGQGVRRACVRSATARTPRVASAHADRRLTHAHRSRSTRAPRPQRKANDARGRLGLDRRTGRGARRLPDGESAQW